MPVSTCACTAAVTPPPVRLLLLEDCVDAAKPMSRILQQLGCEVTVAATISKATAACLAAPEPFDLLIADIMVPDGDGRTLPALLPEASRPRLSVVYSAVDGDREVAVSLAAGFKAHLVKPMIRIDTLEEWVGRAKALRSQVTLAS